MNSWQDLCTGLPPRIATLAVAVFVSTPLVAAPVVTDFLVEEYATVSEPAELSFDPRGVLFVGNYAAGGSLPVIRRVGIGGAPVDDYGPALFDPDAVLFDELGSISGVPGSVLVGGGTTGGAPPPVGYIVAVFPDETFAYVVGSPTSAFRNPSVMKFDRRGRLVFTDPRSAIEGYVMTSTGGVPAPLYDYGSPYVGLAIDPANQLYTIDRSGQVIQIHDADGNLVDASFASHTETINGLAFGPPGPTWGGDLFANCAHSGELLRIDRESGNVTVIGTGFEHPVNITFGPHDENLYVSDYAANKIYRVSKWQQWPIAEGGNDHYYTVVEAPAGISWTQANEEALRMAAESHLATIGSAEEDDFITSLLAGRDAWVGGIQTSGAAAADEGWRWVTGEPFDYTNWPPTEPNDLPYDEIYLALVGHGWNDCCGGPPINEDLYHFVVETPTLNAELPVAVTVRTTPYWKEIGTLDVRTETALFVTVFSTAAFDARSIDFETIDIEGLNETARRGPRYQDTSKDGEIDLVFWYRLDRMPALACGSYDLAFYALTEDDREVTGRLRFEVVGRRP